MEFEFEHTYQMPREEYARLNRVFARFNRPWRTALLCVIAVAGLFSKWTFVLGAIVLVILILMWLRPSMIKSSTRSLYEQLKDLNGPVRYGVSDSRLRFKGPRVDASCTWNNLVQWRELDGWLILECAGIPTLFYRVSDLISEGSYDRVMELARQHGIDYEKP